MEQITSVFKETKYRLIILALLFVFNNNSVFSQNELKTSNENNKYLVMKIDSTLLKYYYVIDIKKVKLNSWRTLLSKKADNQLESNSLNTNKINIGSIYEFNLNPMSSIMVDREYSDSIYLAPAYVGDIIISERLFFSSDFMHFPYSTENIKGLYYIRKKEKQNNKESDNPTLQPTNEN